ncbi:hypothetical protein [Devosia sp.]|uniref:hypothetical protein n=1 Tax=Devosia sp. TaxID=1871048 RepID=UPI001AD5ACB9|nr:hypothetical protein [Devosia sp.]MBN9332381.1 hypothetical protein [Devosia sp.]
MGIGLRNEGDTDIKMVQGTVAFRDPLGGELAPVIDIFPDTILLAGNPGNIGVYLLDGSVRLGHVERDMVSTVICITGVVLADGSVVKAGT